MALAAGKGPAIALTRTYNSKDPWDGELGYGTRFSTGQDFVLYEVDESENRVLIAPGGTRYRFKKLSSTTYSQPPGLDMTLTRDASTDRHTLTENRSGLKYGFFSGGWSFVDDIDDRNGNDVDFAYNNPSNGALTEITDAQGKPVYFETNSDTDVTEVSDALGREWTYGYTGRRLTSVTDPEGEQTLYHYDSDGQLDEITDPRGTKTLIAYVSGQLGKVASITRQGDPATSADDRTTTYTFSSDVSSAPCDTVSSAVGKTTVSDPLGHTTTYCWNAKGQVRKVRDANGKDRERGYSPNGDTADFTEFPGTNGATTTLSYSTSGSDPTNNLDRGDLPENEFFTLDYHPASGGDPLQRYRVKTYTDTQGADESYGYDANGNLASVKDDETSPRNRATLEYTADGTLDFAVDGEAGFDANGDPDPTTAGSPHLTDFAYFNGSDGSFAGNLKTIKPPLTSGAGTALGDTSFTYDTNLSRVRTVTDGKGQVRTISYDELDRVTRIDVSDGSRMTFAYDANGNLTQRADSASNTTTYVYNRFNERTSETFPGRSNTYAYDKAGNLDTITDGSGTVDYDYDSVDRVEEIHAPTASGGAQETVSYAYDDNARTVTQTFPGGATAGWRRVAAKAG
jgi:YD repeat-containing protein